MDAFDKVTRIKARKGHHSKVRKTKRHASLKHASRAQEKRTGAKKSTNTVELFP